MDTTVPPCLFGVQEEELYNKCLFKHISMKDLETELSQRDVLFYPSDSYHILTTKLKLAILEKSCAQSDVQREFRSDITAFYGSGKPGEKWETYKCCLNGCKYEAKEHKKYVSHLQIHQSIPHKIVCQLRGCTRELSNLSMLKTHIKISHRSPRVSMVSLKQNQLVQELINLCCMETSCGHQKVSNLIELKKHLVVHTARRDMVHCPFAGCEYETNQTKTLRSHLSRKHPLQQAADLNSNITQLREEYDSSSGKNCGEGDLELVAEHLSEETEDDYEDCVDDEDEEEEEEELDSSQENEEAFIKSLAMVFNNWMNISGIPYSTVNKIVQEVFRGYNRGVDVTKGRIKKILIDHGVDKDEVVKMMNEVGKDDPFSTAQRLLESEKKRTKFIEEAFVNVKPKTIRLNSVDDPKPETYQYVDIKKSLKNMLEDETYIKQKEADPYEVEEGVVKNVKDGRYYCNNPYFLAFPEAVPLLLFQDELEICNPLGSGKSKHKINVTYMTTLDIQSPYRSRVKSIQLVSLVLSRHWKKHGNQKCNEELLNDLLELEAEGVEVDVPEKKVVKAGLCYIVGDNLGLHQLAELSCCFSSGQICRVCQIEYKDACQKHLLYADIEEDFHPEAFDEDIYNECADRAVDDGQPSHHTKGIKGHCIFNKLKSFHSVRGMPPCLGHDFFEGIFAYDVQHLLDYVINKESLISVEEFNHKLKNFNLNKRDASNRPNIFKTRKQNSKYEGSAGSLRVLSRMMTAALCDVLDRSQAGKMIIKLAEVSEIITAPKLSHFEIEVIMAEIVHEYLDMRVAAIEEMGMSNSKPKHHMLSHYSENYLNYGPLIMLWGMRMESKHVYFKTVIRAAKNWKNVSKTCAERHQMAMISYAYSGLFPRSKFELPDDSVNAETMRLATSDDFLTRFISNINPKALILKKVTIYGTLYSTGNILVLKKLAPGTLHVGVLKAISFFEEKIKFGVKTFTVMLNKFNFYVSTACESEFEVVEYIKLQDYYPLQRHGSNDTFFFPLHHYVSEC